MALKKKILATLVALSAVSVVGVTASAYSFRLNPHVGEPSVLTPLEQKRFSGDASVLVYDGIPSSDDVTFRVRNAGEQYASEYVDVSFWDMWESVWVDMKYFSGEGIIGKYYHLASSYDAGQSENYVTVTGQWEP